MSDLSRAKRGHSPCTVSVRTARAHETAGLSNKAVLVIALEIILLWAPTPSQAQTAPGCDPNIGRERSRMECLTEMVHSLREQLTSLQAQLRQSAKIGESSSLVTSSELNARLDAYVKYNSPLAINLLAEPSTSQNDGRCLEAYSGEVGVIAHHPCDFQTKAQLQWRLLPAIHKEAKSP